MSDNSFIDQRIYELSCVASRETALAEITALLGTHGVSISEGSNAMVSIQLAYPIEKHTTGYFGFIRFSALPEVIVDAEKGIKHIAGILRFLIVTPPPQTVAQNDKASESPRPVASPKVVAESHALTNEALEQKLEEILK